MNKFKEEWSIRRFVLVFYFRFSSIYLLWVNIKVLFVKLRMVLLCNNSGQWQVTCTNWLWLSNTFLYSVLETWKGCMKDHKLMLAYMYNIAFYCFFFLGHWLEVYYIVLSPRCKQLQQGPLVRMTHLLTTKFQDKVNTASSVWDNTCSDIK